MSWFVYILECADGTFYTGCTTDLDRRVLEHNSKTKGAKYTRARRPVVLKYQETHPSSSLARKRELEIQSWTRMRKQSLWK